MEPSAGTQMAAFPEPRYLYMDQLFTREQLRFEVEADAAGLDPRQWLNGKFEFDEWLSDSIATGGVKKVYTDE